MVGDRIARFTIDLNAVLKRVLQSHIDEIAELNRAQLMAGQRSDDTALPPYTTAYAKRKGKPLTPKTLNDKGGFHKGIFTTLFDQSMTVQSSDWKSDILEWKWGQKIFGLSRKSKDEIVNRVRGEMVTQVRNTMKNV